MKAKIILIIAAISFAFAADARRGFKNKSYSELPERAKARLAGKGVTDDASFEAFKAERKAKLDAMSDEERAEHRAKKRERRKQRRMKRQAGEQGEYIQEARLGGAE